MKFAKITLSVALLGLLSIASAEDTATPDATTVSVDTQIEAIQAAPEEERVQLMNEFKQKLMQMNQEERTAAIQEMQSKMQAEAGDAHEFGAGTATMARGMMSDEEHTVGDMTRTRGQEHTQEMQMQTNEQMSHVQNMAQQQAGNQFVQTGGSASDMPDLNMNMRPHR